MSSNALASGGGVAGEPQLKKRRTEDTNATGPVEDEATAREKMEEVGFDPDDVTKECRLNQHAKEGTNALVMNPMSYFCRIGDLTMCRYLLSKGASTTAASGSFDFWFPMYSAAITGQLEICMWLFAHGAEGDIRRANYSDHSPLKALLWNSVKEERHYATCRWFILMGALSEDDSGVVSPDLVERDLRPKYDLRYCVVDERPQLLGWARESVEANDTFMAFLLGTLPAPTNARRTRATVRRQHAPNRCLAGKSELLQLIADYAGIVRGRDLRILRNLVEPLSRYLERLPVGDR